MKTVYYKMMLPGGRGNPPSHNMKLRYLGYFPVIQGANLFTNLIFPGGSGCLSPILFTKLMFLGCFFSDMLDISLADGVWTHYTRSSTNSLFPDQSGHAMLVDMLVGNPRAVWNARYAVQVFILVRSNPH